MTLKDKLRACVNILFRKKTVPAELTVGLKLTRCDECECKRLFDACNTRHGEG